MLRVEGSERFRPPRQLPCLNQIGLYESSPNDGLERPTFLKSLTQFFDFVTAGLLAKSITIHPAFGRARVAGHTPKWFQLRPVIKKTRALSFTSTTPMLRIFYSSNKTRDISQGRHSQRIPRPRRVIPILFLTP
jgi:hypothetical protein